MQTRTCKLTCNHSFGPKPTWEDGGWWMGMEEDSWKQMGKITEESLNFPRRPLWSVRSGEVIIS